jgi:nicotinamidase-related amidase
VTPEGWLVVVDLQHVFADADSPWGAPRFAEIRPRVRELVQAFGDSVVWTRFVAPDRPAGAWTAYYEQFPWALQPPDAQLYRLVDPPAAAHPVLVATTFGKWGPDLAAVVGAGPVTVAGVATDCCVISTVLAAADAGVALRVVTDACAGSTDADHQGALRVMSLYAPLVELGTTAEVLAGR